MLNLYLDEYPNGLQKKCIMPTDVYLDKQVQCIKYVSNNNLFWSDKVKGMFKSKPTGVNEISMPKGAGETNYDKWKKAKEIASKPALEKRHSATQGFYNAILNDELAGFCADNSLQHELLDTKRHFEI